MIEKIELFWGDDWEGLYINGKLVYENHIISASTVLEILEAWDVKAARIEIDDGWIMNRGTLPEDAADVVVCGQGR